jgi:hypothetical protein
MLQVAESFNGNEKMETGMQAQRSRDREAKVTAGLDALSLWLCDLIRQGLATSPCQSPQFWEAIAAQMVDAQAPGIARILRSLASIPQTGSGWPDRLLYRLGKLHLLIEGWQQRQQLPAALQAEIRTQIGWTYTQDELLEQSGLRDQWCVLGQRVEANAAGVAKLTEQRVWLWGEHCNRAAAIVRYVRDREPLDLSWQPGCAIDAELVFYPSAYPLRAVMKTQFAEPIPSQTMLGYASISVVLAAYAAALAANPWLEVFPVPLIACVPHRRGEVAIDSENAGLPIAPTFTQGWQLMAVSGGEAIGLFGEWNGEDWQPLSAFAQQRWIAF